MSGRSRRDAISASVPSVVDLISAAREGDQSALGALYDEFGAPVYRMALRIVGDPLRAEEVTQDVFLSVWEGSESFDARRGSVADWLVRCARSRAVAVVLAATRAASHSRSLSLAPEPELG